MNCKNHPSAPTKRKCYQCKAPICSICQIRGSHHIFCSENCHEEYINSGSAENSDLNPAKTKVAPLIEGTPHVDSAYSEEFLPSAVKSINMETLGAIEEVISKTDKELKSYLKDLEIIFEASNKNSLAEIQGFFEKRWDDLKANIEKFRDTAEKSADSLEIAQRNNMAKHSETASSLDRIESSLSGGFIQMDSKISRLDTELISNYPDKFNKVNSSLDALSVSLEEKISELRSNLAKHAERISFDIMESREKSSSEINENLKSLDSRLSGNLTLIHSSIDSGRAEEKELFEKNEARIKELVDGEKRRLDSVLSDYHKKFNLTLSTNKDRISKFILSSSTETKDFLDFQRTELANSVSKIASNLEEIFKKADSSITSIGLGVNRRLEETLLQNSESLSKNLDNFEKGIDEMLDSNRRAVEDYLSAFEDEHRGLLEKFEGSIAQEIGIQKGHFEQSLASQAKLVNTLLDNAQTDFEASLKDQRSGIKASLEEASGKIDSSLIGIQDSIGRGLNDNTRTINDDLLKIGDGIKNAVADTEQKLQHHINDHRERISRFLDEAFSNEKQELKRLISTSQEEASKTVAKLYSDISSSNETNRDQIESAVRAKLTEIDGMINSEVCTIQKNLDITSKRIEDYQKALLESTSEKLLKEFKALEKRVNEHHETRGKILIDEMACLVVSNKGNMEEVLNKAKVNIDAQIEAVEKKSGALLKEEIGRSVDVFNLNLSGLLGEIRDNLKKKVQAIPSRFSLSPAIKAVIVVLLMIAVLNPLIFYVYSSRFGSDIAGRVDILAQKIEGMTEPMPVVKSGPADAGLEPPKLSLPGGYTSKSPKISLEGRAKGDFVMLSLNERPHSLKFVQNGAFKFDPVELSQGKNTVSVTAYTEKGIKSESVFSEIFYRRSTSKAFDLGYNIARGDVRKPHVSITFDGGSNAFAAPFILDTLKKKGIKTTMFLTGKFIEENPELTRKIVEYGHEVGNHSYSHPHFIKDFGSKHQRTAFSKKEFEAEILRTSSIFKKATGQEMAPYWRAPYGEINDDLLIWAKGLGYTHVGWTTQDGKTMDSLDWVEMEESKLYRTSEEIKSTILNFDGGVPGGSNGSIIIMHLGSNRSSDQPFSKLGEIIDGMRNKGYRFVKISELIQSYGKRVAAN